MIKAYYRALKMILLALAGVFVGIFFYPRWDGERQRRYIQTWSKKLFKRIGIKVSVIDEHLLASHSLIVSNHLSWLDIFLINVAQPSRFIAKESIRSWPLVGWLATKAGTVYLNRSSARDLRNAFNVLVTSLGQGEHFVFFPEGTSGGTQNRLLPFHSNLFEAAINAGASIQPCVLHYVDESNQFHFAIETTEKLGLVQSILRVLRSDTIHAKLIILPTISTAGMQRRELTQVAYDAILEALSRHEAYKSTDSPTAVSSDLQGTPQ